MVKNYIHNPYVECQCNEKKEFNVQCSQKSCCLLNVYHFPLSNHEKAKQMVLLHKVPWHFQVLKSHFRLENVRGGGGHIRNEHCNVLFSNLPRKISSAIINFHFLFIVVRNFSAYSPVTSNSVVIHGFKAWIMTKGVINCRNYFTLKMMEYLLWPEDF